MKNMKLQLKKETVYKFNQTQNPKHNKVKEGCPLASSTIIITVSN